MLKNINQSMVNRSIAGGVNCKCLNGGSNGSSDNGGKITVEFTVYTVDGEDIIKQEDVESLFNEILNLDPEKYTIYQFTDQTRIVIYNTVNFARHSCDYGYTQGITDDGTVVQENIISSSNNEIISFYQDADGINYEKSKIFDTDIIDNPQGTLEPQYIHKLTLYYREL